MQLRSTQLEKDFPLVEGLTLVGRSPDCALMLESEGTAISRKHAEIRVTGTHVSVRDLGSRNGTRLNGKELAEQVWYGVRARDRLVICDWELVFVEELLPDSSHGSCLLVAGDCDSSVSESASVSLSAQSIASILGNAPLDQLRALLQVTEALLGVLKTEDVLERTTEILLDIFPQVERAAIGFFEDNGQFKPRWWRLRHQDASAEIQISQTVVQHVRSTIQAIVTNDADRKFPDADSVHSLTMRSIMCAPLIDSTGHVSGIIHVDAHKRECFKTLDLQVLASVATQISLAVEYAKLHEEVVRDRILVHDLELARDVQLQYLPDATPSIQGYEIAGFYRAARAVGGDYYDFIPLANGRIALVLGDVCGKGAPAALTMVKLATETRAGTEICDSAAALVTRLNDRMRGHWITLVVIYFDPASHVFNIANAGHEYPLLRRANGYVEELTQDTGGTPLSVTDGAEYRQESIQLQPGESLVLFSDGFPDATNGNVEDSYGEGKTARFGKQRVLEELANFNESIIEFPHRLVRSVDEFCQGKEQFDDLCMINLRRID